MTAFKFHACLNNVNINTNPIDWNKPVALRNVPIKR